MTPAVQLLRLGAPAIAALASGDLAGANRTAPVELTPYFVRRWRPGWGRAVARIEADPCAESWLAEVIWDPRRGIVAGRAGFHGLPDGDGTVEVTYDIDPAHRRAGYARAALGVLLARAVAEPGVRTVLALIRPQNSASRRVASRCGFTERGEDGVWLVYSYDATVSRRARRGPTR